MRRIGGGEISRDRGTQPRSIQNINVLITIDAGRPFAAEELACGGIDLILECIHQRLHLGFLHIDPVFHPEVHMRRDVSQRGLRLIVDVGIEVVYPEILFFTHRAWRSGCGHHFRDIAQPIQTTRQFARIIDGNDGVFQNLDGFSRN